jgi:adenine-specific DNA-methyltransferase
MDEVNAAIEANADMEELVDQPLPAPGVVRVAGPFTMEGVIAREQGPDDAAAATSPIGGAPGELWSLLSLRRVESAQAAIDFEATRVRLLASTNAAEVHLDKILRLLKAAGVDFAGNRNQRFARLEPINSSGMLHAEGAWIWRRRQARGRVDWPRNWQPDGLAGRRRDAQRPPLWL